MLQNMESTRKTKACKGCFQRSKTWNFPRKKDAAAFRVPKE